MATGVFMLTGAPLWSTTGPPIRDTGTPDELQTHIGVTHTLCESHLCCV